MPGTFLWDRVQTIVFSNSFEPLKKKTGESVVALQTIVFVTLQKKCKDTREDEE